MKGTKTMYNLTLKPILIGTCVALLSVAFGLGVMVAYVNSGNSSLMNSTYMSALLQTISIFIGTLIAGSIEKENQIRNCIATVGAVLVFEAFLGCVLCDKFPINILWQFAAGLFGGIVAVIILLRKVDGRKGKRARSVKRFVQNTQRGK